MFGQSGSVVLMWKFASNDVQNANASIQTITDCYPIIDYQSMGYLRTHFESTECEVHSMNVDMGTTKAYSTLICEH